MKTAANRKLLCDEFVSVWLISGWQQFLFNRLYDYVSDAFR
jgi:hypothetical protein